MTPSPTLKLTQELIQCPSITPHDAGCQDILIARLETLGFTIERLRFGDVDNFWARRGTAKPLFVFLGHSDVVPTGPETAWDSPPFVPTLREGYLYGRGAADMKGNIAAMLTAMERFIAEHPNHPGSLGFLITSDEEGPSIDGTAKVIEHLEARHEKIDWCLVGEPSSDQALGDIIKNGRRGSLHGKLTVHGIQGHIAYPHLAKNPIHDASPAFAALAREIWDNGNEYFPPTTFQISNIHSGTGAANVIPGELNALFNFRYSSAITPKELQQRVEKILNEHQLRYDLAWTNSASPFFTAADGKLIQACRDAIHTIVGVKTTLSTTGGTSDGRFIAPTGSEVIEMGVCNHTIHKINERVNIEELEMLSRVYQQLLENLFPH